jgi:hypothetical protein
MTAGYSAAWYPEMDYFLRVPSLADCHQVRYLAGFLRGLAGSPSQAYCRQPGRLGFRELADWHRGQYQAQAQAARMGVLNANHVNREYPKGIRDSAAGLGPAASVALCRQGTEVFQARMAVSVAVLNPAHLAGLDNRVAGDMAAGDKIREAADNTADGRDLVHPRKSSRYGQSKRRHKTNHSDKTKKCFARRQEAHNRDYKRIRAAESKRRQDYKRAHRLFPD